MTRRIQSGLLLLALSGGAFLSAASQRPDRPESPRIRAVSQAVVLDLVVRDSRGRPVEDLQAGEIEVLEDGVSQKIRSFRLLGRGEETGAGGDAPTPTAAGNSLRHINLVSLVFEHLGTDGRRLARQAALDFLSRELDPHTFVAVFSIDRDLYALQHFGNDLPALRAAVDEATSGRHSHFGERSQGIEQQLTHAYGKLAEAEDALLSLQASTTPGREATNPASGQSATAMEVALTQAALAQITINSLRGMEALERSRLGHASLDALLVLLREQRRLAGRKTVIFFSEGLEVTNSVVDRFRYLISEANLSSVSVYAVDARGLITAGVTESTRTMLREATDLSRQQMQILGTGVSRSQVMIGESAEESLRLNVQGTLQALATGTGGFLIANTNDARPGMQRIREDIQLHYELVYVPEIPQLDGRFREIEVRVSRPGVQVQTRSGYFALPPDLAEPPAPFELPLLSALQSPARSDFSHQPRVLHFSRDSQGVEHSLLLDIPLSLFTFESDQENQTYFTHFAILALLVDEEGRIVERFSQDYPLTGPLEKMASMRLGKITFIRHFRLPPGRYRVDSIARDAVSGRFSRERLSLEVAEAQPGIDLSSVAVIGRADQIRPEEQGEFNPLRYQAVKIVPNISDPVSIGSDRQLGLYCVVYPGPGSGDAAHAEVELIREGRLVARGSPELAESGPGRGIPLVVTFPLAGLQPGLYQVRVVAQQGDGRAESRADFVLAP